MDKQKTGQRVLSKSSRRDQYNQNEKWFILSRFFGFTMAELAEIDGKTPATVRAGCERVKQSLAGV